LPILFPAFVGVGNKLLMPCLLLKNSIMNESILCSAFNQQQNSYNA